MASALFQSSAVITVSYNSNDNLREFLSSIRESQSREVTVVVADNGTVDILTTEAICRSFDATLLRMPGNLGYGGAMNQAASTLPTEISSLLISNPDVVFSPNAIEVLLSTLDDIPRAGAVGPRVLNSDGGIYPSARMLPSLRTGIGHAVFGGVWPSNPWSRRYKSDAFESSEMRAVGWLSGSCVLVRRDAFDELAGFDDNYFMYFEDVDLGYRLGNAGWLNIFNPAAVITHAGAHSTSADSGRMLEEHHRSAYRYLGKKYSAPYLVPLRWTLRIGLTVRARYLVRKANAASRREGS